MKHQPYEITYTPQSQLKRPRELFKQMWWDLLASRELAYQLMIRDIKAKYRQSFLGIAWAFLPSIILAFGFTLASEAKVITVGVTNLPYTAYVMFSTALWQTFVEALNAPIQAVTSAKPMLARVNFPREALILAKLGEVFFNFAIKLILITGLFIWFRIPVSPTIILTPVGLVNLVFLGTLIGILVAPFSLLYQDVSRGLTLLTSLWLFLTPVVYPVPSGGIFALLVKFNPVTPLLVTIRELATTGILTQVWGFWIVSFIVLGGIFFTWLVFRLAIPFVVERVSS